MIIGIALLICAVYLVAVAIDAWAFMLAIGIMHNDWWDVIPPMGFGTAFSISLALSVPCSCLALHLLVVSSLVALHGTF